MKDDEYKQIEKEKASCLLTTQSSTEKTVSTIEDESLSKDTTDIPHDIMSMVDSLLEELSHKFEVLSQEIFKKMDKMEEKLDMLETSLNEMIMENQSEKKDIE
ncbi:hypothetical protein PORY_000571 [Pneumocystis oryctolagi]|uniref:Uncharacterized protein n=1 Tax=Pneumocystis oryctolagi TaxID=42067 RepID=A0ACB7CG07_9ASCO|nr:hypothetical protein PORY_000571 [Pneumocystis oryctolagi]